LPVGKPLTVPFKPNPDRPCPAGNAGAEAEIELLDDESSGAGDDGLEGEEA
jgi:hypothetical protein